MFEGFTKRYGVTKLLYMEEFSRIDDAIAAEKRIKGRDRAKKLALIRERNPRWNDLAWDWYRTADESGESEPNERAG